MTHVREGSRCRSGLSPGTSRNSRVVSTMKSYASLARLGLFALLAYTVAAPWSGRGPLGDRSVLWANEPLPLGPMLVAPAADFLPNEPPPPVLRVKVRVPACGAA